MLRCWEIEGWMNDGFSRKGERSLYKKRRYKAHLISAKNKSIIQSLPDSNKNCRLYLQACLRVNEYLGYTRQKRNRIFRHLLVFESLPRIDPFRQRLQR